MVELRAGFARRDITPPLGAPLMHNLVSRVASVTDPLLATVAVLDDGDRRAVIIGTDLCAILETPHREIREAVGVAVGTDPAEVILNVSHTHSAPYVTTELHELVAPYGRGTVTPDYMAQLRDSIVAAAREALAAARPATISVGRAVVEGVAANRRPQRPDGTTVHRYGRPPADMQALPEGLIDPFVTVVRFEESGGTGAKGRRRPIGAIVNYACHLTAREPKPTAASADFIAPAMRALEGDMDGAPALFLQGCGGNTGTGKYVRGDGEESVQLLGGRLAEGARRAVAAAEALAPAPLRVLAGRVAVELDPFPPVAELRAEMDARMAAGEFVAAAGSGDTLVLARRPDDFRTAPVIGVAIGDFAICALPGEVFVDFGLDIQQRSPFGRTLVAAYCDNSLQYIPTREAFAGGEYEVNGGWRYIAPGGGEQLADGAVALLEDLAAAPVPA